MKAYTLTNEVLRINDPYISAILSITFDGNEFVWTQTSLEGITTMYGRGDFDTAVTMCGLDQTDINVVEAMWPPK